MVELGVGGLSAHSLLHLGFIALLLTAALWDLAERRLPNWLVLPVALLAPLHHFAAGGWAQLLPTWSGAIVFLLLAVLLLWLFQRNLLGGGDVKLLLATQLFLGGAAAPRLLLAVALAGGLLSLCFLLARWARRWITAPQDQRLPYGMAIAGGALLTLAG